VVQLQKQLALDWIRSGTRSSGALRMPTPPEALRRRLREAAQVGHVRKLTACIDEVEALGPAHASYAAELRRLSQEFQLSEILAFIGDEPDDDDY
jgi:hypothetical protein